MLRRAGLFFLPLVAVILLAYTAQCNREKSTWALVFNQAKDSLDVAGTWIHAGWSQGFYVVNGDTDSLALSRLGRDPGKLVIRSLVARDDPNDYDAAINVHEDSLGHLYLREFSPYIDAALTGDP